MLVRIVTASKRVRSAPIGTPALTACTAAFIMAVPPSAWTFTNCTPGNAAALSTAPGYCIRNVMKFQVEEDSRTELRYLPHRFRPGRCKKLAADLEHAYKIGNLLGEF